jgi:hypothetical protein
MTSYLIWMNRGAGSQLPKSLALLSLAALGLTLLWTEREVAVQALAGLRRHMFLSAGIVTVGSAVLVARRRVLKRAEFAKSWLAALPTQPTAARWEALLIEALPAGALLAGLAVTFMIMAIVLGFEPARSHAALIQVWALISAAVLLGSVLSYAIPATRPADLPPGSRYVPQPRVRSPVNVRASLTALGCWPIRQMFARAQPKMVARATVPVLLCMPLGSRADDAMLVMGLFVIVGALLLLVPGAVSISFQARRWMAPLPVGIAAVMRALLVPAFAVVLGASGAEGLILATMGTSYRTSLAIAASSASIAGVIILGGVLLGRGHSKPSS